ncbi:MAG: 2-C-methyl-D-erythritol 2,4-cyclodiphosphate synthase [Candidatus Oleimicrobiaceae bacterium]
MRIGQGYDVHRLVSGRPLILGGVHIPFPQGLLGHSDADVLCHAIADALLGAAAAGDIGRHFPNTDPQWKGVSSLLLLERVAAMLAEEHLVVVNVDATVVAERPLLAPYIDRMRENIASALRVPSPAVSVKATTTEGLGLTGRGEGIAASAVALVASKEEVASRDNHTAQA